MPQCIVYGSKPDNGPGALKTQATGEALVKAHPQWAIKTAYLPETTTASYTSAVASIDELEDAVRPYFPQYNVVAH